MGGTNARASRHVGGKSGDNEFSEQRECGALPAQLRRTMRSMKLKPENALRARLSRGDGESWRRAAPKTVGLPERDCIDSAAGAARKRYPKLAVIKT